MPSSHGIALEASVRGSRELQGIEIARQLNELVGHWSPEEIQSMVSHFDFCSACGKQKQVGCCSYAEEGIFG